MFDDLISLSIIVLLLGMRHGLDLDHLAAIDTITRNVSEKKKLARNVGILFSIGHGTVVIVVSIMVGVTMRSLKIAPEIDFLMQAFSILLLLLFSLLNLYYFYTNMFSQSVTVITPKLIFVNKLLCNIHHPLSIACVGGMFAISFDTVSQVTYFSLSSAATYGWFSAIIPGLFFMAGMILIDGINGWVISFFVNRADDASQIISGLLSIGIGLFGAIMSISGIVKLL